MKKVLNWLQENTDKVAHAAIGTYIAWIVAAVIGIFTDEWGAPIFFGLMAGSLCGFVKELHDSNTTKTSDAWDWVATVGGAILGVVMWMV